MDCLVSGCGNSNSSQDEADELLLTLDPKYGRVQQAQDPPGNHALIKGFGERMVQDSCLFFFLRVVEGLGGSGEILD